MADENKEKLAQETSLSEEKDKKTDWLLEILTHMVNGSNSLIGVTLSIGGILISGELVSGHKYFEWFAAAFSEGVVKDPYPGEINKYLNSLGNVYLKDKNEKQTLPVYIHLKNARFYQPGGANSIPTTDGIWWRGKIASIDGFVLGKIADGN